MDLQAFYEDLLVKYEESHFRPQMPVEGDAVDTWYAGLNDLSPKQVVIYTPMISAVACEIALVEAKDAADVEAVKAIFQARIDYQTIDNGYGNPGAWYPATVEEWQNNSRIVSNGNFVMLIVWNDCDQIVEDFNALF